jgi:thiamine pyrophosphokinase
MKRCVIVGGAPIERYDRIKPLLRGDDYLIYCDSGLKHMEALGRQPDLIIGDFDSHERPETDIETIVLPMVKDDTDTMFAVKEGIRRDFGDFLLIGALGGRLDHTMVNVYSLLYLDEKGKNGAIADDFSLVRLVSRSPAEIEPKWAFFSLVNIDGSAHGVTIRNAKYELDDAEIPCSFQYATSNEPLPGKTALVSLREGRLLLICDHE